MRDPDVTGFERQAQKHRARKERQHRHETGVTNDDEEEEDDDSDAPERSLRKNLDKELTTVFKALESASKVRNYKNAKTCAPNFEPRKLASGYLFGGNHVLVFYMAAFVAFSASILFMTLYLVDSTDQMLGKFQHRWINVRWHVDGDKQWSHIYDAAPMVYGLTFGLAFACYMLYICTPHLHLWNFRMWVINGVFPMQAVDDIISNLPLVWLILCVSGQDDFYELLYGSGIWVLAHALFTISQSYGYDDHFWAARSKPWMTFSLALAAVGLFWSTVIASLEYRDSNTKTNVNDGARWGIYSGMTLHLVSVTLWGVLTFNGKRTKGVTPQQFPLQIFVQDAMVETGTKGAKAAISELHLKLQSKKEVDADKLFKDNPDLKSKQKDWNQYASMVIMYSSTRWILSLCFKLAVTLSFVLGVALRLKVEANQAKVDG